MSSQMHQVETAFDGTESKLVSFTVDPEHDTPTSSGRIRATIRREAGHLVFSDRCRGQDCII